MTTYKEWYDRIDNLLTLQVALQADPISTSFTRRELIELKLIISTIMELTKEDDNDHITNDTENMQRT